MWKPSVREESERPGYSLLELLVVMAIIAVLIALMLPAVQQAREVASRTQCANNVKQLSLGCIAHATTLGRFPTDGWGWNWIGDPDRGTDHHQPGGWAFNVLPYIEQQNLYNLGSGLPLDQKGAAFAQRISTPVKLFNCPSRRQSIAYPNYYGYGSFFTNPVTVLGRMDYACNVGTAPSDEFFGGPSSLSDGDSPGFGWPDTSGLNGVMFMRSEISLSDLPHGTSNTYLLGEKYLNVDNYYSGADPSDNESLYAGADNDNSRTTSGPPMRDLAGYTNTMIYGSAHPAGLNMAFCDGAVRFIPFTIDPNIHLQAGSRN